MIKKPFLFGFLLIFWGSLIGQVKNEEVTYSERRISILEDVIKNPVEVIYQDRQGFMWFGSQKTLQRFDGTYLRRFLENEDTTLMRLRSIQEIIDAGEDESWINMTTGVLKFDHKTGYYEILIPDKKIGEFLRISDRISIFKIFSDNQYLWIGTNLGLIQYDIRKEQFTGSYQIMENHPGNVNDILKIKPAGPHSLWIGTRSSVYLFSKKTYKFSDDIFKGDIPKKYNDLSICNDDSGNLWIGYGGDLYSYSSGLKTLKLEIHDLVQTVTGQIPNEGRIFNADSVFWNPSTTISKIIITDDQRLLISSKKYLFQYDPANSSLNMIFSPSGGFNDREDGIIDIFSAKHENIWISTAVSGIVHLVKNKQSVRFVRNLIEGSDKIISSVYNIDVFENGEIWAGRSNGKGLARIDLERKEIEEYPADGLRYEITRRMVKDRSGNIWAIADGGIIYSLDPVKKEYRYFHCRDTVTHRSQWFFSLVMDDYGYLWAGGAGGGLIKLDKNTGKYQVFNDIYSNSDGFRLSPVWQILKLKTDELLIFNSSEVIRLKIIQKTGENGTVFFDHRFSNYLGNKIEEILPKTRQSEFITGFIDSKQDLWIGTDGAGAVKYSPRTDHYQYYNISNGMPSNAIKSILEDNYGNIWMASDKGFSRLDPVGETINNVFYWSESDYPNKQVDWWDGHRDNQGIFYYGFLSDPIIVDPADFLDWKENTKNIIFSDLRINNRSQQPWTDHTLSRLVNYRPDIHLDYTHHILTLNYAVMDYMHPGKYRYRYKLEGFDQDWIEAGTNTFLTYSNLPSGEYKLVVNFSDTNQFDMSNSASLNIYKSPAPWDAWWAWLGYIVLVSGTGYFMIALIIKRNRIRKRLEKEHLELEKVKEIEEAKNRFFTQLSHEIRTPLSLILQPVESLCRGEARGDEPAFYSMIRRNALRLSELLDQMLDLSHLQSGRLRVKAGKYNIVEFVRLRVANFESLANSCGLNLEFESLLGDLDVYFDRDKMEKVIDNLISNAIKFTPGGGYIRVSVHKYESQEGDEVRSISRSGENHLDGKEVVAIVVSDTGIGIPEDQQEKIFERFYRVRDDDEYEGMGIGLSLTKELIDLHHGSVRVDSKPGKGSAFYVVLPLGRSFFTDDQIVEENQEKAGRKIPDKIPDVPGSHPVSFLEHPGSGKGRDIETARKDLRRHHKKGKPVILFIEDNEDMRKYVKHSFDSEYIFIGAGDGIQGLEVAREYIPDIIVSDIMMPGIDGIEICRRVKEDLRTRHIPVILLTAKAGREDRVEGLEEGADDYITKPFDIRELKYRIRNQLNQLERLREKYVKAFLLNDPVAEITSRDDAFLTDLTETVTRDLEDPSFSVSELSREMGISRSLLYRKLKALTGQQPNEFIRTIRLKKAAELLVGDSGNISEIAYAVGFNNISYFSRCFHTMYQMAPSEYVKRRARTGQI